jgi:hypothetical protein
LKPSGLRATTENGREEMGEDFSAIALDPHTDALVSFFRTALGGVASGDRGKDIKWREFGPTAMEWVKPSVAWLTEDEHTLDLALDRTISTATWGRCYFKTEDGDQGLC